MILQARKVCHSKFGFVLEFTTLIRLGVTFHGDTSWVSFVAGPLGFSVNINVG